MKNIKLLYWFEEIGKEFNNIVGKKSANLGEMTKMGLPVPPGFAISLNVYHRFLLETGLMDQINNYIYKYGDLKGKGISEIDNVSENLQQMISNQAFPPSISDEITHYYNQLCEQYKIPDMEVSVRSSGDTSRPGMFETYLNIKGSEEVLKRVKAVWMSTFTSRAIAFRCYKDLPIDCDMLGVAVMKMVNAKAAGIGFTVDPVTGDDSKVIIEANWGLGEGVVSGDTSIDRWVVNKKNLTIIEEAIGKKLKQVVNKSKGAEWDKIPLEKQARACLTTDEIKAVAKLAISLEHNFGTPQDMEWAVDNDFPMEKNIFLLQTRPAKVFAINNKEICRDFYNQRYDTLL